MNMSNGSAKILALLTFDVLGRVTRCVFEKVAQNIAQSISCEN
jgi:hypothetical protein